MPVDYEDKLRKNEAIKKRIAYEVWGRFVSKRENPRIWIDAGTSAEEVARVISDNWKNSKVTPSVMTNNLGAWMALKEQTELELYFVGGRYNKKLNAIIELRSFENALRQWHPDIIVIAVSGINKQGLYCSNVQDESPVKAALATKFVETRIIIADHTKLGSTDLGAFLDLKDVGKNCYNSYLVTDGYDQKLIKSEPRRNDYIDTLTAFKQYCGEDSVIAIEGNFRTVDSSRGDKIKHPNKNTKKSVKTPRAKTFTKTTKKGRK